MDSNGTISVKSRHLSSDKLQRWNPKIFLKYSVVFKGGIRETFGKNHGNVVEYILACVLENRLDYIPENHGTMFGK